MRSSDLDGLPEDAVIVDLRDRRTVAAGFVPGSVLIELGDDLGSWTGWLTPRGAPLVLIADPDQDLAEAVTQLAQIGLDTVVGAVTDVGSAATAGFEVLGLEDFLRRLREPDAQLLDVRMPAEHEQASVPGAAHRFLPDLFTAGVPETLDPERPVLVACGSGRRAVIAAGLLHSAGYRPIVLTGAGVPDIAAAYEGAK
ncbi:hypothetical protein GCM10029992_47530 [Glycomyces albus]